MDMYVLILIFIIIFMLHNLEEIIAIEKWLNHTYPKEKERIPLFIQRQIEDVRDMTAVQFSVVVFMVSVFASIVVIVSVIFELYFLFIGLSMFFALNVFTHPIQSLLLKCYTPGLWTSVLLIIPYNIFFFYRIHTEDMLTMDTLLGALIVFVLAIPTLLFSHKVARKWVSREFPSF